MYVLCSIVCIGSRLLCALSNKIFEFEFEFKCLQFMCNDIQQQQILAKLCNNNAYHIVYCMYMEKTILR